MVNILIVDDASFMRGSLKYIVEMGGHQVVGMAKDGNEAIAMYKQFKPDIVTLDILMKGMDGITAGEYFSFSPCAGRRDIPEVPKDGQRYGKRAEKRGGVRGRGQ